MPKEDRKSIGKEKAIELYNSGWWKEKTPEEIFRFQFYVNELAVPFDVFHEATEKTLRRSVWTHEFAFWDGLEAEYLGLASAPTLEDIINLIPEEKRIIINLGDES